MTNKDILKITLNLVTIYVIGGLILAGVYATTSPMIFKNNEKAKQEALKKLIPEADSIVKAGDWTIHDKHAEYYEAKKGSDTLGYIVQSFGKGYSSYINTLIAVDKDMKIKKINVLSHAETPGLGDEIEYDSFTDQFKGKSREQMKVLKTETKDYVQAISGATISSRAVTEDAVKNGLDFLNEKYKGGDRNGSASR
ncbi:MAG: RnfABCDGE type electron transport complex subunit G [Nitrospiraceae bacterium]|nr:RnfABCDGE type electron transport complex subunit G [Nitrospiraceae bacterium]